MFEKSKERHNSATSSNTISGSVDHTTSSILRGRHSAGGDSGSYHGESKSSIMQPSLRKPVPGTAWSNSVKVAYWKYPQYVMLYLLLFEFISFHILLLYICCLLLFVIISIALSLIALLYY